MTVPSTTTEQAHHRAKQAHDRAAAIIHSPLAVGQVALATHIVAETDMSVEAALEVLSISARNAKRTSLSAAEIYEKRRSARNSNALALGGVGPTPISSAQKRAEAVAYISNPSAIYEQRRQSRESS